MMSSFSVPKHVLNWCFLIAHGVPSMISTWEDICWMTIPVILRGSKSGWIW